jgi:hypothetical protein
MSYWKNIRIKLQFGGFTRVFFDGLSRIGIRISPYYIVLEGLFNKLYPSLETGFEEYDTGFLGPEDIKAIAAIPKRNIDEKVFIERLEKGNLCFGIKLNGELVAFTWCNLTEFTGMGNVKPLKHDEAYLFDAYTLIPFRGKGIAPFIRYQLYKEADKLGKKKLFSVSNAFNTPSIKFKKKLNAVLLEKHISITIFNRWKYSFLIK